MVDDDIAICELVNIILTSAGFTFDSQNKVYGSFEYIKAHKPDLVLLDLHLPDGNGLNICKKIKTTEELKHIPVIILTTREFNIEKEVAYEAGADLFISKPFDKDELIQFIKSYLSDKIEVKFWGVRGSTPTPESDKMRYGGNTPCIQITLPGVDETLIFDAGTGIRNLGDHLVRTKEAIHARLFITHPHWDHIQGLPFFKPLYGAKNHITISMPEQLEGNCKQVLSGQMQYTYFPVTPKMLIADVHFEDQPPEETSYNGYAVSFILANHPTNTAIFKIKAHGKTIIYGPDNELIAKQALEDSSFLGHLVEFCADADLLIHDAQYSYDNYDQFRSWGHSPWQETLKIAELAKVKDLILFSHDPMSTDSYLDELNITLKKIDTPLNSIKLAKELSIVKISLD